VNAEERRLRDSAHAKVQYALRTGQLAREPCEKCGAEDSEAHHEDYSKPLEVRWLCNHHHRARHQRLRRMRNYERMREKWRIVYND
jgi:hypothetical protein